MDNLRWLEFAANTAENLHIFEEEYKQRSGSRTAKRLRRAANELSQLRTTNQAYKEILEETLKVQISNLESLRDTFRNLAETESLYKVTDLTVKVLDDALAEMHEMQDKLEAVEGRIDSSGSDGTVAIDQGG